MKKKMDINGNQPNSSELYFQKGNTYFTLKRYKDAIVGYTKAIELKPDYTFAYHNRGLAYSDMERYEDAIKDYTKAIELKPDGTYAYNNRGLAYSNLKKDEDAIKDYTKVIELKPDDIDVYNNRGLAYYDLQRHDDAIKDYTKAIELDANYIYAYNNRGLSYYDLKRYDDAIEDYTKAIELKADYTDAYYNRGLAYYFKKRYEDAIKDDTKAIELDANCINAYNNRGLVYSELKRYEDAIKDYTKAIELDANYINAYNNRGLSYFDLERYEDAIRDCTKAIELDSSYTNAYNSRGLVYSELKRYEDAIEDYTKVIKLNPNCAEVYFNRGLAYSNLEKFEDAIEDYTKAIELKPDNTGAYYSRGLVYSDLERYGDAIEDYTKAIESNADYTEAYYNRGLAYNNLKRYSDALKDYNKVLELNTDYVNTYLNRGITLSLMEKYEKGIDDFTKYLRLNKSIHPTFKKMIYQAIGENYIHIDKNSEGIKYFILAQNDPVEILACFKSPEQMENVVSPLIDQSQDCRFKKIIVPIKDNEKLVNSYKAIYISILKIILTLLIKDKKKSFIAHYTTREVASQLILKKTSFHLSSVLTTNDPSEGETILKYLNIDTLGINSDNENIKSKTEPDFQAFIGCFSLNEKSLNQFRLYGKENYEEATGVSIILNNDFFNSDMCLDILPGGKKIDTKEDTEININLKYPIFRCLYIDTDKPKVVSMGHSDDEDDEGVGDDLTHIQDFFSKIKETLNEMQNKDKDIIENLFLTLRYLVKHSAFKEEQECRIIRIIDINEDAKNKKDEQDVHFTSNYSQMYINYQKMNDNCLEKIIFGPKAKGLGIFNKALKHEQIDCDCEESGLPFS